MTVDSRGHHLGYNHPAAVARRERDKIRDEVVSLYHAGESASSIARRFGVGGEMITSCLKDAGVEIRTTASQRRALHRDEIVRLYEVELLPIHVIGKRVGVGLDVVRGALADAGVRKRSFHECHMARASRFHRELASLWESGVSVKTMAASLGVTRARVARELERMGIPVRDRHQQALIRMTDPEQRGLVVRQAHFAMAPFNGELADLLELLGVRAERERQVGALNLDLSVGDVAIEVHKSARHPFSPASRELHRVRALLDRGFAVGYMWVNGTCGGPRLGGARELVSWLEGTDGTPPAPGEYRVVRGCGELVSSGRGHLEEHPAKTTFHKRCRVS